MMDYHLSYLGTLWSICKAIDFKSESSNLDQNRMVIPPEIFQFVGFSGESQVSIPPLILIDVLFLSRLFTR